MMKIVAEFTFEYEAEIANPGLQLGKHGVQLLVNDYDLESAQMILDRPVETAEPDEPADEA